MRVFEKKCVFKIFITFINAYILTKNITLFNFQFDPDRPESNYFEIEILDRGFGGIHSISLGVVNLRFPLDTHIGRAVDSESIAYQTGEGTLYHGGPRGQFFGERSEIGDKIGMLGNIFYAPLITSIGVY